MATVGVSTERGAVRAVLLGGPGTNPPGRVLLHREETPPSDDPSGVAVAVEATLTALAADIGREPDAARAIEGVAVAYRDDAERRAIGDRLAAGRWSGAALVPVSAAHLAAVSSVPFLDKYSTLLVYDAVPGRHTFTVVDSSRSQVLGSDSIVADGDAPVAIGQGIRNAWSLLDSASVEPNGVVLIGSMAEEPGVDQVLRVWFDAPVVAGSNAALSTAIGAAYIARQEAGGVVGPVAAAPMVAAVPVAVAATGELAGVAGAGEPGGSAIRRPSGKLLAVVAAGVVGAGFAGLVAGGVLSPGGDGGPSPAAFSAARSPSAAATATEPPSSTAPAERSPVAAPSSAPLRTPVAASVERAPAQADNVGVAVAENDQAQSGAEPDTAGADAPTSDRRAADRASVDDPNGEHGPVASPAPAACDPGAPAAGATSVLSAPAGPPTADHCAQVQAPDTGLPSTAATTVVPPPAPPPLFPFPLPEIPGLIVPAPPG